MDHTAVFMNRFRRRTPILRETLNPAVEAPPVWNQSEAKDHDQRKKTPLVKLYTFEA